jgi:DNA/RNA endonuclease G (NUC1)
MRLTFSRTRPASWLVAAVLLVGCSSAIDRVTAPDAKSARPTLDVAAETPTLVVTEIFADPNGGIADATAEWFEVYNPGTAPVTTAGWTMYSNNTSEKQLMPALSIAGGSYAVFGNNADPKTNGGVTVLWAYSSAFQLANSNSAEKIEIHDASDRVVDVVTFGRSAVGNRSFALRRPDCSNSVISGNANWVTTSNTPPYEFFPANYGTPGKANDSQGSLGPCIGGDGIIGPLDLVTVSGAVSVAAGGTTPLSATATDADGDAIPGAAYVWASSDPAVASVSTTGVVTGVAAGGPVTITATTMVGGITKSGTAQVTVQPPSGTSISFSGRIPSDPPIPVGFQDQLFATKSGATAVTAVTWEALNPDVATIDARGVITARAAGNATFKVTMSDGSSRTTTLPMEIGTTGDASLYGSNVLFGAPTTGGSDDDILVTRPQYSLSYNRSRGGPNWVAYRLTRENRGDLPGYRCDCFATDPAVTAAGEVGLTTADYTGSGFDRGHMVRSNDRELGHRDQAATYYLSNVVPQWANTNQGRWADLEDYLQKVEEGAGLPDVYIVAGGRGEASRIAAGRIAVPTHTWKVALVLPHGMTPAQISRPSDVLDLIAVDMPNQKDLPKDGDWRANRVTVDSVEKATGYDFLAALPDNVETIVESGDHRPTASYTGATSADEGSTLTFDASSSSDQDVGTSLADALSYQWSVNGQVKGIGATLSATFADDGQYVVQLIVSDLYGWADTTTKTVAIANVAPTVGGFAGATIIRGEGYRSSGSFTDPGADSWTATVSYGDGSGTQPLALSGTSFSLAHAYGTAGTFTVTVTVRDDDGGSSSRTATVVVASAAEAIGTLSDDVAALGRAGTIANGESNALDASLRNALKSLDKDDPVPAANELEAFVNKVEAMQQSGRLDAANAGALTAYARRIVASIG